MKNRKLIFTAAFMALATLVMLDHEDKLPVGKLDPTFANLTPEELQAAERRFFETLGSMSKDKQQQFMNLIKNITPEQKADLLDQLK